MIGDVRGILNVKYKSDCFGVEVFEQYRKVKNFIIANNCNDSIPQYVELINSNCFICRIEDIVVEAEFDDENKTVTYYQVLDISYPGDGIISFSPIDKERYQDIVNRINFAANEWNYQLNLTEFRNRWCLA